MLYQQAWTLGVPIAAFEMGHLYEYGAHGPDTAARNRIDPDLLKAWSWYQKGAGAGEPNALARFAERDEKAAVVENTPAKRHALLLAAFRSYAAAAERAKVEDWPDDAWKNWRYHRATIARLLAREGMMQQVADAYTQVRDKSSAHPPTLWERIQSMLHL
jgi:TPR repeat protein